MENKYEKVSADHGKLLIIGAYGFYGTKHNEYDNEGRKLRRRRLHRSKTGGLE